MSVDLYYRTSYRVSQLFTRQYSSSFSLAASLLERDRQGAIFAIYGFVRLADEVVDSFHGHDRAYLLARLAEDTDYALDHGISTNPVLVAFAHAANAYGISREHVHAFLRSMRFDLSRIAYTTPAELQQYIYGSADVVGLMCLRVFCNGNAALFGQLEASAQRLGTAFQKVNFLRDLRNDMADLGRSYFPEISNGALSADTKRAIEESIQEDLHAAWAGIRRLPGRAKLAVAIAFYYYKGVFERIRHRSPQALLTQRVRIPFLRKLIILAHVSARYSLRLL